MPSDNMPINKSHFVWALEYHFSPTIVLIFFASFDPKLFHPVCLIIARSPFLVQLVKPEISGEANKSELQVYKYY